LERELKSISHAMIAHGIHIYIPSGHKNYIIGSRLTCAECNEPWFMNFTECFLCGAVNPFLYRCDNCRAFNSITNASGRCNNCGKQGTLNLECPNPQCLSNTDKSVHAAINQLGGVFNMNSGFKISLQRCLNCGSQYHKYQTRKIYVVTTPSTNVDKGKFTPDDPELLRSSSFVVFRLQGKDKLRYSLLREDQYLKIDHVFELTTIEDNLDGILDKVFSDGTINI